jgi:hypothetical protein
MEKTNKFDKVLLVFQSINKDIKYYNKIVNEMKKRFPNLDLSWYILQKNDFDEIQKSLDKKFEPEILKTMDNFVKNFVNIRNVRRGDKNA